MCVCVCVCVCDCDVHVYMCVMCVCMCVCYCDVCVLCFPMCAQRAAERGFIDDIISPRDTRRRLCADLDLLKTKSYEGPKKKHGNIPL